MLFRILLLAVIFFGMALSTYTVKAQTISPSQDNKQATSSPTYVQYDLAYPGILPDHPFYKLKILRDKISAGLINDPLKKIEFYLLQTDKGILASAMLIDKNKVELAQQTSLKAEHNYTLLTQELYNIPKKPNEDFFKKLRTAGLKHQEVLQSIVKRAPKDKQNVFKQVIDFSKRNVDSVEKYRTRKKFSIQ